MFSDHSASVSSGYLHAVLSPLHFWIFSLIIAIPRHESVVFVVVEV